MTGLAEMEMEKASRRLQPVFNIGAAGRFMV